MKKARSRSFQTDGFTLVEVLVSMTVLILIVAMLAQVVQNTSSSIQRSTKGMDNTQLSTIALDRIGNSIVGMISSGQGTLVAVKNASGNDGLAMVTNGRVRSRVTSANPAPSISVNGFADIRMGARGFCVINTMDADLSPTSSGGNFPLVPMLNWGDGTVRWPTPPPSPATGTTPAPVPFVRDDPLQALADATSDVASQAAASNYGSSGATPTPNMLQFSPLSRSIFRFEICFLLSNGKLISGATTAPPCNSRLYTNGIPPLAPVTIPSTSNPPPLSTVWPLACSAADSNDTTGQGPNGQPLYVRAVVVGIASLDLSTQKILTNDQLQNLASINILAKTKDDPTTQACLPPAQVWDISNPTATTYQNITTANPTFPPAVLQNIRFTQRYFYVN